MSIGNGLALTQCLKAVNVVVSADKTIEQIIANTFEFLAPSHFDPRLVGMA